MLNSVIDVVKFVASSLILYYRHCHRWLFCNTKLLITNRYQVSNRNRSLLHMKYKKEFFKILGGQFCLNNQTAIDDLSEVTLFCLFAFNIKSCTGWIMTSDGLIVDFSFCSCRVLAKPKETLIVPLHIKK